MTEVMDYKIIKSKWVSLNSPHHHQKLLDTELISFIQLVKRYTMAGWNPVGGMETTYIEWIGTSYTQTLVKHNKEERWKSWKKDKRCGEINPEDIVLRITKSN